MESNVLTKVSFKSNIKFVSNEKFRSKYSNDNKENFDIICAGDMKASKNPATKGIVYCVAGAITSDKNALFWHLPPCQANNPPSVYSTETAIKRLEEAFQKNIGKNCESACLIIGGGNIESSKLTLTKILDKIKELNIRTAKNTSILWHSFYGQPSAAAYNAKEDTWYIPILELGNKSTKKEIKVIKEKYSEIFISENDKVFIDDKKIENNILNTRQSLKKTVRNILNNIKYTLFPFIYSNEKKIERWRELELNKKYDFYDENPDDISDDYYK